MNITELVTIVLSTGLIATIISSFISYALNRNFDRHSRALEMRKKEYEKLAQLLAGLFNTASVSQKRKCEKELPICYRNLQSWASRGVVKRLNDLLGAVQENKGKEEAYKNLIIEFRKDLLGKYSLKARLRQKDLLIIGKLKIN